MFKDVKDKLVNILTTLTGSGQPIQQVFGYMEPSPEAYPCAMVSITGNSNETRLDSDSNLQLVEFVIRVFIPQENNQDREDQRLMLTDAIFDAFRTSANIDTLGGLVDKFDLYVGNPVATNEDQPVFGFDLLVQASKLRTIS